MAVPSGGSSYSAKGGDAGPATSSNSTAFDSSGWQVEFGGGTQSKLIIGGVLLVGAFLAWKFLRRGR